MYSAQLLDHFDHPRNSGRLESPSAGARAENPACGDVMELALRVENGRIQEARFLAKGCVAAVACGSVLTELLQDKTVNQAGEISREDLLESIGGLPPASMHAAHLAIDALRSALQQLTR
jgi:nitrogen fixation NifU-like protein